MTRADAGDDNGLSDREFDRLRQLVHARTGIALGHQKRQLLRARLGRRLRALGLHHFADYYAYLTDAAHADEVDALISAVTTNKTDFFREPHHFSYLTERWAPALHARARQGGLRRLRLWSAACSTGEEPYTLAMVLREARLTPPDWDVRILGTDIDTDVLKQSSRGIYPIERTASIPPELQKRHFRRREGAPGQLRVRPELRDLVTFRRLNLTDATWPFRGRFDVVLCRNVLIYFDRETQRAVLDRLRGVLGPRGLLCLGHSESLVGLADGLVHIGSTMYVRADPGSATAHVSREPARAETMRDERAASLPGPRGTPLR